jgi:hypothetical protein
MNEKQWSSDNSGPFWSGRSLLGKGERKNKVTILLFTYSAIEARVSGMVFSRKIKEKRRQNLD